jgi:hypothetical protein
MILGRFLPVRSRFILDSCIALHEKAFLGWEILHSRHHQMIFLSLCAGQCEPTVLALNIIEWI